MIPIHALEGLKNVYYTISQYSVFPRHCFSFRSARVISLFGVQLLGFIQLLFLTSFPEVFTLYSYVFFIENTKTDASRNQG